MSTAREPTPPPDPALRAPALARFGVVASEFHGSIVDRLLGGALGALHQHGVDKDRIVTVRVPGAFEIPWACDQLARSGSFAAIIALGVVVRGETPHFDFVARGAADGCGRVMAETRVPVLFGVLTTDNEEQALARAGGPHGNKGWDAATAAIKMTRLAHAFARGEIA